jgi:hypothetical protein
MAEEVLRLAAAQAATDRGAYCTRHALHVATRPLLCQPLLQQE